MAATIETASRGTASHPITEPVAERAAVRVLVADDHPLFRRGIALAVRRRPGLELIGEATDGREALALIAALQPDVAVLDHRMPGLSGVEVCAQLRLAPEPPSTAVLLLSAFEDPDIVAAAIGAGAAGYVGKTASQAAICAAIEAVAEGGMAFATRTPTDPVRPLPRDLRPRQRPA